MAKRSQPPGKSSPARIAANQKNQRKSTRKGRPPSGMPAEVLVELGSVPVDPALVHGWLLRASAALWRCEASGQISGEYASRLRNGLGSIAKFAPVAAAPRPPAAGEDDDDDEDEDEHPGGPRSERVNDPHTPIAR